MATHPKGAAKPDEGLVGVSDELHAEDMKLLAAGYWFRYEEAERVCQFIETMCRHSKGRWRGQLIKLELWQRRMVRRLFGWYRPDGTRRYRKMLLFVPRKNAKSTLAAALELFLGGADGEKGAIVLSAATTADQARMVFDAARAMVDGSPELAQHMEVRTSAIQCYLNGGVVRVISGRVQDGENPHAFVCDEYHQHKTSAILDSAETAVGARQQPLILILTTAGDMTDTPCFRLWEYAAKIRDGILSVPEFLPVLYGAHPKDDWTDPKVWERVNPNYGVSVDPEMMREACEKAKMMPTYQAAFKTRHLNLWVNDVAGFIPMDKWKLCDGGPRKLSELSGRVCFGGLDLAQTRDLNALLLVFPWVESDRERIPESVWEANKGRGIDVLARYWLPEENIDAKSKEDGVEYQRWVKEGLLVLTPGNTTDWNYIRAEVNAVAKAVDLREVGYDRQFAHHLAQQLYEQDGVTMVEVLQTFNVLTPPMKALERLILSRGIRHGGNEILTWNASNVVARLGEQGGLMPSKRRSRGRIDGIPALVMALSRALCAESGGDGTSVYETRGVRVVGV